ncbi:hypothetical protein PsorP6_006948 [Peronosclerospora sorghi]|uniref:Uncharacterized protein n=1 Tax=Peronosclerospora sorghi TaxID=230839 RepID=A0ACC0WBL3_9STRA|nr:hypothetical protein PsorP6_006948 [Peronosclerospora sorghi]
MPNSWSVASNSLNGLDGKKRNTLIVCQIKQMDETGKQKTGKPNLLVFDEMTKTLKNPDQNMQWFMFKFFALCKY